MKKHNEEIILVQQIRKVMNNPAVEYSLNEVITWISSKLCKHLSETDNHSKLFKEYMKQKHNIYLIL